MSDDKEQPTTTQRGVRIEVYAAFERMDAAIGGIDTDFDTRRELRNMLATTTRMILHINDKTLSPFVVRVW